MQQRRLVALPHGGAARAQRAHGVALQVVELGGEKRGEGRTNSGKNASTKESTELRVIEHEGQNAMQAYERTQRLQKDAL